MCYSTSKNNLNRYWKWEEFDYTFSIRSVLMKMKFNLHSNLNSAPFQWVTLSSTSKTSTKLLTVRDETTDLTDTKIGLNNGICMAI